MTTSEAVSALLELLQDSGCQGAEAALGDVVESLGPELDESALRRALGALRSRRCFALSHVLCEEALPHARGEFSVHLQRQWAQALIELGAKDRAREVLEGLLPHLDRVKHGGEVSEVWGLLGRDAKQRFVDAAAAGAREAADHLRTAVSHYAELFDEDPAWHGANLVALLARAERDGISVESDSAGQWAERMLTKLEMKSEMEWNPWTWAGAAEACLAKNDHDRAAKCFRNYWDAPSVDEFALAGTRRQLEQVWQIHADVGDEFLASLPVFLNAREVATTKGKKFTASDLCQLAEQLRSSPARAEARFGAGTALPIQKVLTLLKRAESVCRISSPLEPERSGTGFLVDGGQLSSELRGRLCVLTNHHVLHGSEATDVRLSHEDYAGVIDVEHACAEFHYWGGKPEVMSCGLAEVVEHSPREELDFALATLEQDLPAARPLPLCAAEKPLRSRNFRDAKQRSKVFVIGHPQGGDLSFSLSDNEVVDHELDGRPIDARCARRIHYRTPTEPGSSGSPVLQEATQEVVGLHRSGRARPLRSDWPRRQPDEEYEANEAVCVRSIREHLAGR